MSLDLKREPRKEVMNLSLVDYGFKDEKVERETDSTLFCKKHDGFTPIIFKSGPSWKNNKITRWISVEGIPLVHTVDTDENIVILTPIEYLKTIWGKGYDTLTDKHREALEQQVGVTVSVKPIEIDASDEKEMRKLKANSVLYDADLDNLATLGTAQVKVKWSDSLMHDLWRVLAGGGLVLLLQSLGVLG